MFFACDEVVAHKFADYERKTFELSFLNITELFMK